MIEYLQRTRRQRGVRPHIAARCVLALCALGVSLLLQGCSLFEDNGTHLAHALEKAAKDLRASGAQEIVVRYETLDGPALGYYIEITPSVDPSWTRQDVWGSYLVVSGLTSGGTSYHNRFVFVPRRLYVKKEQGGAAELVLRKELDRISVIALR